MDVGALVCSWRRKRVSQSLQLWTILNQPRRMR